jgi:hypothetical protein
VCHKEEASDGKGKYTTTYEQMGSYNYWEREKQRLQPLTHLRVKITGGHQHQIRSHLAHLLQHCNGGGEGGYVVGDETYATAWRKEAHSRLWLHNSTLGVWSLDRFAACVDCPLPQDLKQLFRQFKKDQPRQLEIDHNRSAELQANPFITWLRGCDMGDIAKLKKLRSVPSRYSGNASVDFAAAYSSCFSQAGQPPYLLGRLLDIFEEEQAHSKDVVEFVMRQVRRHCPMPEAPPRRQIRRDTEEKLCAFKVEEERRRGALERSYDDQAKLKRAMVHTTAEAREQKRARREAEAQASSSRKILRDNDARCRRLLELKDKEMRELKVRHAEAQRNLIQGILLVGRR